MKYRLLFIIISVLAISCIPSKKASNEVVGPTEITWDTLLSDDEIAYYEEELRRYNADPEYMGSDELPPPPKANEALDDQLVRIPGFAVGMDTVAGEYNKSMAFLFVPYQGACIHVPPPPPNQTIFVEMDTAVLTDPYTPIYLEGTIHVEPGENELAPYFYRFEGSSTTPYQK